MGQLRLRKVVKLEHRSAGVKFKYRKKGRRLPQKRGRKRVWRVMDSIKAMIQGNEARPTFSSKLEISDSFGLSRKYLELRPNSLRSAD